MSKKQFTPKYVTFTNNRNMVKVGSSHAGKMYYGIARLDPKDEFDFDKGYALAKARCDAKIAQVKYEYSLDHMHYYEDMVKNFSDLYEAEKVFFRAARDKYADELDNLHAIYYNLNLDTI